MINSRIGSDATKKSRQVPMIAVHKNAGRKDRSGKSQPQVAGPRQVHGGNGTDGIVGIFGAARISTLTVMIRPDATLECQHGHDEPAFPQHRGNSTVPALPNSATMDPPAQGWRAVCQDFV